MKFDEVYRKILKEVAVGPDLVSVSSDVYNKITAVHYTAVHKVTLDSVQVSTAPGYVFCQVSFKPGYAQAAALESYAEVFKRALAAAKIMEKAISHA